MSDENLRAIAAHRSTPCAWCGHRRAEHGVRDPVGLIPYTPCSWSGGMYQMEGCDCPGWKEPAR